MRNISFSLTTAQVRAGTKDVTRRLGWEFLRPGDKLMACVKCMGRRKGEPLERIRVIEIVDVRREPLRRLTDAVDYGFAELAREGFADDPVLKWPSAWVPWFCSSHKRCTPETEVTRIEFRYDSR